MRVPEHFSAVARKRLLWKRRVIVLFTSRYITLFRNKSQLVLEYCSGTYLTNMLRVLCIVYLIFSLDYMSLRFIRDDFKTGM